MNRQHTQGWWFWGSWAVAYLLQLLLLPAALEPFKPYWLGLLLIYWILEAPERMGLGMAFIVGLLGDLLVGEILGEQALRLVIIAFIISRFRARLRFFPLWQQTLAVFAILLNDRIVILMIRAFSDQFLPPLTFWLAPVVGMALWPLLFLLMDDLRARWRIHDK